MAGETAGTDKAAEGADESKVEQDTDASEIAKRRPKAIDLQVFMKVGELRFCMVVEGKEDGP